MKNVPETRMDAEQQFAANLENMTDVECYEHARPAGAEYDAYVEYLLGTELFAEERLAETRALIERIGRGEYTLDEIRGIL